jgi:uncharacterized protein YeaO (DUF488 family)
LSDFANQQSRINNLSGRRRITDANTSILIPQLSSMRGTRYRCPVEAKRSNRRVLQVKRVYDPPSSDDGIRVLVDRLWPRGLTKTTAAVDLWLKDMAPSVPLRRWFNHDPSPSRWSEFTERYFEELDTKKPAVDALAGAIRRGRVTLLFGARDPDHNNAVALFSYFKRVID